MASQVQICNLALIRLGSNPILSLSDGSKSADALKICFDFIRDIVLRDYPWNFATSRMILARLDETPAFGYSYTYQLPSDCLRVLGMVGDDSDVDPNLKYKIEKRTLLTDEIEAKIKYITRIEDTNLFDAKFNSALAFRLAAEVAYYLTGSVALEEAMSTKYLFELSGGKSIDSQEDTPDVFEVGTWEQARV